MAKIKISNLPLSPGVALTDIIPEVQAGVTYKATLAQVQTAMGFNATILSMANGGTSANLTPSLGSIPYSSASAFALTSPLTNGQLVIGSTGLAPVTSTLTAGTGISVINAAGSITINGIGGGVTWAEILGTSGAMLPNNGYIANNAALVTLSLPTVISQGDIVEVAGKGAGLFKISQSAGQQIVFQGSSTTLGAAGSLTSTLQYQSVRLLCITANFLFTVLNPTDPLDFVLV